MNSKTKKRLVGVPISLAMLSSSLFSFPLTLSASAPAEHAALSRSAATEGMVLLENDGALPLRPQQSVAVFGRAMIDYVRGGGGSGQTNVDYMINILQGLQNKEKEGKISLYQPLVDFYTQQVTTNGIKNDANITVTDQMISDAAAASETAVITIGRYSSEGSDRTATPGDYYLSEAETDLITRVAAAFEKTVVVLNVGAVMDTSWIDTIDGVSAVLQSYQAGMEGGNAVADVLVGDVNPSGKTVDTYAKSYEDYPSSDTFYESSAYVNYEEDIFVGYRYFETFDPNYEKVNYEFGYGLSYTTFALDGLQAEVVGDQIVAEATVTNTGDVAGKEVVQTYFSAPQGQLGKPAKELAAFAKTDELAPGESQTLTMSFDIDDMSSYDDTGAVAESAYVLEAGDYRISIGNSIKDAGIRGSVMTYTVEEDTITEQLTSQAAPSQLPRRLKADGSWETLYDPSSQNFVFDVSATETTRVEMEDHSSAHETVRTETYYDADFKQQRCMAYLNSAGIWAEYTLNAEEAGEYEVIMSVANGYAALTNCITVTVNGLAQPGISFDVPQTGDGNGASEWYNFEEAAPFTINLEKGINKVRIIANHQNPNYDYMLLRRVGEARPVYDKAVPAEGAVIQAESFNLSGYTNSATYAVRTEDFTRDGKPATCLAYMNYAGNYVSYYLDVAQAGEYDLILNCANGRATFTFDPGIDVDGNRVEASIEAVQTGDGSGKSEWYNFEDLAPVTITLPEGGCILTLTGQAQDKYPNIDYFTLVPHASEVQMLSAADIHAASPKVQLENLAADPTEEVSELTPVLPEGSDPAVLSEDRIMLVDVYENPDLMDAFLAQISDEQLAAMLGGQPNTGTANTGGMGNLMEFGIPNAMTADGPQGIRIGNTCTALPVSTLLASTWDVDFIEEIGRMAAVEARTNGIDIWLAPGMNIHRDPLCGRNFEYYSEDPLLTGKMAAAITRGCQSEKVSITLKHFCVNNKETNRNSIDTRLSERALREIYLKGFEIAVKEADPWSIMTSYNFLNGVETSEHHDLLTNIARGEWNFGGIFMTDWGNNSNHARELMAGNDVKMPSGSPAVLLKALERGVITRADLEASVKRLLNMIMKTSVFDTKILNPAVVSIKTDTTLKAAENIIWSQTVKTESTKDSDGGLNLGYCDKDAWAEYYIDVAEAGSYDLSARSASNAGAGAFDVLVDGNVIASFDVPGTGGWQNWTTLDSVKVKLPAGRHLLRIQFTESGSNLNWLRFVQRSKDDVPVELKTALQTMVDAWENEDLSLYTPESAAALTAALENAKAVLANEEATRSEILNATLQMTEAIGGLEYGVQTIHLETAIEAANVLLENANNYIDADALRQAVADGQALLDGVAITQEEADAATNRILDEIARLQIKDDVTGLEDLIKAAEAILEKEDQFTEESVQNLKKALEEAKAVLEDPERDKDDLNNAYNNLASAIASMQAKANKDALKAVIEKAEAILAEADKYAPGTIAGLKAVLNEGRAVYDDPAAVQKDVNAAARALTQELAKARLLGDVNNDGQVDTTDAAALLRAAAELEELDELSHHAADVNLDGVSDTSDASLILQYAAEVIDSFQ